MKLRYGFVLLTLLLGNSFIHAQRVNITNGVSGAGHLDIDVDSYGHYGNWTGTNTTTDDQYQPIGSPIGNPTFTTQPLLFLEGSDNPGQVGRLALTSDNDARSFFNSCGASPRVLGVFIVSPVSLVNSSTAQSSFRIADAKGFTTYLNVQLTQTVGPAVNGVTYLRQRYVISNVSSFTFSGVFVIHWDHDMMWSGSYTDDVVGTDCGRAFLFGHEPGNINQGVVLSDGGSSVAPLYYVGGKAPHTPAGGPPAFAAGTDCNIWTNNGLPQTWRNYVAFVGYNTDGNSGTNPGDGMVSMEWRFTLAPGQSVTIVVDRTYGRDHPWNFVQESVAPSSLTLARGQVFSGNVGSLASSDDNRLVLRPFIVLNQAERPIQAIIEGNTTVMNPRKIVVSVESHANITNLRQWIEAWNFATNAWDELDMRTLTTTDATVQVSITQNAQNYVSGTGTVRLRLSYMPVGLVLFYPWEARIDWVNWSLCGTP